MTRGALVYMSLKISKTSYWIGGLAFASLFACVARAQAQSQLVITYSSVVFGVMSDSGDLRESMRREHRERLERTSNGNSGRPLQPGMQGNDGGNGSAQAEQRDAENAARRARWQRMSPEEREQMRRDIHQAGRAIYPQNPPQGGN